MATERRRAYLAEWGTYNHVHPITGNRLDRATMSYIPQPDGPHSTFSDGKIPVKAANRIEDSVGPYATHKTPVPDPAAMQRRATRAELLAREGLLKRPEPGLGGTGAAMG